MNFASCNLYANNDVEMNAVNHKTFDGRNLLNKLTCLSLTVTFAIVIYITHWLTPLSNELQLLKVL
jgi:hypothetical protein